MEITNDGMEEETTVPTTPTTPEEATPTEPSETTMPTEEPTPGM